jgi:hypothetical protein
MLLHSMWPLQGWMMAGNSTSFLVRRARSLLAFVCFLRYMCQYLLHTCVGDDYKMWNGLYNVHLVRQELLFVAEVTDIFTKNKCICYLTNSMIFVLTSISWRAYILNSTYRKRRFPINLLVYLFMTASSYKKIQQRTSWQEGHLSSFRSSDKRWQENVYSFITRAYEYKNRETCLTFVASLYFTVLVAEFLFSFLFILLPFLLPFTSSPLLWHR